MTDQTETARALLWRHQLPEDVIDGVLCLHAQELAAVKREAHDERRPYFHMGLPCTPGFGCHVGDLIDPTRTGATGVPAGVAPATDQAAAPTDWIDGHPQLEAIAAAVWEQCRTEGTSLVIDDPRNIAVAALAAVLPAPADRATIPAIGVFATLVRQRAEHAEAALARMRDRLEVTHIRVRKLHAPDGNGECRSCQHSCPCPTVQVLDGDLRRMADETQQPEAEAPCCSDPTCTCNQVNAAGRCDCAKWDSAPADETPQPAAREWCKCPSCWGWFVEDHPGEDLDELGKDLGWWSGLPEHRDAPAVVQQPKEARP